MSAAHVSIGSLCALHAVTTPVLATRLDDRCPYWQRLRCSAKAEAASSRQGPGLFECSAEGCKAA